MHHFSPYHLNTTGIIYKTMKKMDNERVEADVFITMKKKKKKCRRKETGEGGNR